MIFLLKVGHFTTDNASNNQTMMAALAVIFQERDIAFDARDRRVMCFAHIINLCSGRIVSAVSSGRDDGSDRSSSDGGTAGSRSSDPIARARAAVRAIRGSGSRRGDFDGVVKQGNVKGWFKRADSSQPIKVPELQLLRDVRTRWDSVYHMLRRLRNMREVCIYTSSNVIHAK
jgi:hypothetical protein